MMDTKAAFEKWAADNKIAVYRTVDGDYAMPETVIYWTAWQASRAAIEIDLPYNDVISDSTDQWWAMAVDACAEAITSHGIRIKGKTE